jgi:hypothetical protein
VGRTLTSKNDDTIVALNTNSQSFNINNDALSPVRGEDANSAKPLPVQGYSQTITWSKFSTIELVPLQECGLLFKTHSA